MQHRHFATIAAIIKDLPAYAYPRKEIAERFAATLAFTNRKFDHNRFMRACGVND